MPAGQSHGGNASVEVPAWISHMSNTVPCLFPKYGSAECVSPLSIKVLFDQKLISRL